MSIEVDHDKRRIEVVAGPGFSGGVLSRAIAEMFDGDPRTCNYDFVIDVRESVTGATHADFQIVVQAYHRHEREPGVKYGCFITLDPNYPLLTSTLDALLGDRSNKVFVTPERARAFLDKLRG
jgi:hypothetical protein